MKIHIDATEYEFVERGEDIIKSVTSLVKAKKETAKLKAKTDKPQQPNFDHPLLDAVIARARDRQVKRIKRVMLEKIDAVMSRANA